MNNALTRFRRILNPSALVHDERGLTTVEYVIVLVLIAAAAVGAWSAFGGLIIAKIGAANSEISDNVVIGNHGSNGANTPSKSDK
jgi:Flp pilus assembly pilin Flp